MAVAEKRDRSGIDREGPLPHKGERGPFRIKENCTAAISLGVAVPCNQKLHRRSATEWTVRPPEIHRLHNRMLSRKLRPSLGYRLPSTSPSFRTCPWVSPKQSRDTDNFYRKTTALRRSHARSRNPREPRARTKARESPEVLGAAGVIAPYS